MENSGMTKAEVIASGKTKVLHRIVEEPENCVVGSMKAITAHDDKDWTREFDTKAQSATTTTCRVFELLKIAGIPVAYHEQISPTEFKAPIVDMIPLEVVARRYAVGSYTKRNPNLAQPEGELPHRFHKLEVEFFLKTTNGGLSINGETIIEGLDAKKGEEDPFIENVYSVEWRLLRAKKPIWEQKEPLGVVDFKGTGLVLKGADIADMEELVRKTFLVLEGAWNVLGFRLIDFKIEFGILPDGTLVVADVIDNDSWRLRDFNWKELSKEVYRQGGEAVLSEVEENYAFVAELVSQFRIPVQTLVLWTGSKKDTYPKVSIPYVTVEYIALSGHKAPQCCLDQLEKYHTMYPDGGVIVVKVGRSDGLGPILAARTVWPVIAIPATYEQFPDDIHSSTRMPSQVPLMTSSPEENAILAALNVFSVKNPVAYMERQYAIETLDKQ